MAKKFFGGIDIQNASSLGLFDSDSSNSVKIKAPAAISADYSLTLPSAVSSADDVMLLDASGVISFGKIGNVNVDAAAGIVYSKLNLADSILNADINSAAGIVYSKLDLSDSIVNADINSAAAIVESKLALDFSTSSLNTAINNLQSTINNFEFKNSVLDYVVNNTLAPATEVSGDRYLLSHDGGVPNAAYDGASAGDIVEFDGSVWVATTPTTGTFVAADDEPNRLYLYGGSSWSPKEFEQTTASVGLTKSGFDIQLADAAENASGIQVSSGSITLNNLNAFDTDDLSEGAANFYYTEARFDSSFSGKSTTNLIEGTNLYYTQARFDSAFSAKSTTDLSEGTNLYFTDARAKAAAVSDAIVDGVLDVAPSQNAVFDALAGKQNDVITTEGDLVIGNGSGEESRLPIGSAGQVLTVSGSSAVWSSPSAVAQSLATDWVNGDGATKSISHNFGTRDIIVQIFDENFETIEIDVVDRTDTNTLDLTSSAAPATTWRVLIQEVL